MRTVSLGDFGHIPAVAVQVASTITTATLPTLDEVRSLASWTRELTEKFGRTPAYFAGPPKQDRSAALAELAYLAAENRFTDEQMYVLLSDADSRWGKYVGRRDRERRLLDFINRARTKIGYDPVEIPATQLMEALAAGDEAGDDRVVWNLRDFLAADFPIDWLLEGLHPRQGFGLITGFPGVGKTQFGIGMALHLSGQEHKFLHWPVVCDPQRVLFLSLEMGKHTIHHLITTVASPYDDLAIDNFDIAPIGETMHLDTESGQTLFDTMLRDRRPQVVLIDSLQKVSSKELSDEVATKELMGFLQLMRNRYDCSVLVIHHMRKKSTDQQNKGVELSDVYGSVYLTAEPDWVLNLRVPHPDEDPDLLVLSTLKVRLGKTEKDMDMRRNEQLGFYFEGDGGIQF